MSNAFTLLDVSILEANMIIRYGMYYIPEGNDPRSSEYFAQVVDYLPYIAYPYEVIEQCRT